MTPDQPWMWGGMGRHVDISHDHVRGHDDHLLFRVFRAMGLWTNVVGSTRRAPQRPWRFRNGIRNTEKEICDGRDNERRIHSDEKRYLKLAPGTLRQGGLLQRALQTLAAFVPQ
jgi:hypothetical protein